MDRQLRLRIQILTGLFILIALSNLYFFLVKVGGLVFLLEGLVQLTLFILIMIWTLKLIWRIIKNSEWRIPANYLTILAIPVAIFISGFDSLTANENSLQSDVKIKACYEGTMNTSRLYLRENGEFEDFNIGFFAHVNYVKGTWTTDGDTIKLTFRPGDKHNILTEKLIIKDKMIFRVELDTLLPTRYYLGECRGLN